MLQLLPQRCGRIPSSFVLCRLSYPPLQLGLYYYPPPLAQIAKSSSSADCSISSSFTDVVPFSTAICHSRRPGKVLSPSTRCRPCLNAVVVLTLSCCRCCIAIAVLSTLLFPSRAVPCRAVPCRAVPCRAVPCRAKPNQAKPSQAKPSQAKPSQAKPSQAKPSQALLFYAVLHGSCRRGTIVVVHLLLFML